MAASSQKRVLVIDDDPETCALVSAILIASYEVETAADGLQGIKLARQKLPHLIVCDIMMPRMGGKELLDAMSRDPSLLGVPVVTMSGWDLDASTRGVLASYSNYRGHMRKPLNIEDVIARARAALGDVLSQTATATASSAPRQRRIIIADDDQPTRQLLTTGVGPAHLVFESGDGRDAWAKIRQHAPDLLILDLVMPGATGFELLREMAAHNETRNIPVIVVTAILIGPAESGVLFKDFPSVKHVLQKPVDAAVLHSALDALFK